MRRTFALVCGVALATACGYDWDSFELAPAAGGDAAVDGAISPGVDGATNPDGGTVIPDTDAATQPDSVAPVDAAIDTGPCTPSPACINVATTCGNVCDSNETTCRAGCSNGGSGAKCRNDCKDAGMQCKAACNTDCQTCLQDAGCPSATACAAAVN